MIKKLRFPVAFVLAMISVACASGGSGSSSERGAGNVLTYDELVASNQTNVAMAIQALRPAWLRARGQTSLNSTTVVTVFMDGVPQGNVSELTSMRLTNILDVTYFSGSDATFRFGTLAGSGGAIEVRTLRREE